MPQRLRKLKTVATDSILRFILRYNKPGATCSPTRLAASSRERALSDPEKGSQSESEVDEEVTGDAVAEDEGPEANAPLRVTFASPEVHIEEDERYLPTGDDDNNNDDIITCSVEQDEYSERKSPLPRPGTRRRLFSPTPPDLKNKRTTSGVLSWWSKVSDALDSHTSPSDLESYVPHYRNLPIISGVVIPFSILLEIPGLTEDWYVRTEGPNNKTIDRKSNTVILDVALALSIACAVVANICLIARFMEKKVKYTTIMCIVFLTIHDIINIICVTVFGVEHRFDDGFTYGEAFWMTVCSTAVSSLTNVTLIVDLTQTSDFSNSGSGLTRKQRALVISIITLMIYIAFGALIQAFLLDTTFLSALYFTVVSIETIGFGDIALESTGARVFICVYSIFGILNLALAVGLIRETVLEGLEVGYRKRAKAVRLRRRAVEWETRVQNRWWSALEWRLREAGKPVWVKDDPSSRPRPFVMRFLSRATPGLTENGKYIHHNHPFGARDHSHPRGMHINLEALPLPKLEAAAMEVGVPLRTLLPPGFKPEPDENEMGKERVSEDDLPVLQAAPPGLSDLPLTHARLGRMAVMLGSFAFAVNKSSFVRMAKAATPSTATGERGSQAISHQNSTIGHSESLEPGIEEEEKRAFYTRLLVVWILFIVFWLVGSAIFMATEKWSFGMAMYFCFIAFTTIGYGDFTPKTPAGRSIFVVWALLGVATMTILISILSEAYSDRYKRALYSGAFTQAVKRYRERIRGTSKRSRPHRTLSLNNIIDPLSSGSSKQTFSPVSIDAALSNSQKRVEGQLEALPHQVLSRANTFNENFRYLIEPETAGTAAEHIPDSLKRLMNDIAGVERLGEKVRYDILRDTDMRNSLLAISIEGALRQMIEIAEEAIESLKERDRLVELLASENHSENTELNNN